MKTPGSKHIGSRQRRQQIVRAALECFAEKGFTQTTMADIRQRANASSGSIYHHYGSKEQLAAAVLLEGIITHQSGIVAELSHHHVAKEGIYAIVHFHLRWINEHQNWARFMFQMREADIVASAEENIREANRNMFKQLFQWLEPHIENGAIKKFPKDMYMPLIMGPCFAYGRLLLSGMSTTDISSAGEILAMSIWQSIKGERDG